MYKYAKQLKEAGFPQGEPEHYTTEGDWIPEEERIYIPSLSELIDECGGNKISGFQLQQEIIDGVISWNAYVEYPKEVIGRGYTPDEAVVNLWLILNNNNI